MVSTAGQRKYLKIEGSRASTDAKPQTNTVQQHLQASFVNPCQRPGKGRMGLVAHMRVTGHHSTWVDTLKITDYLGQTTSLG